MFVLDTSWTSKKQGRIGEASAAQWLAEAGAIDFMPMFESPDYDLGADFLDDRPVQRIQVKTSTNRSHDRYHVTLCARGGNRSWNGVAEHLDASCCDYVFVHVGDGRRWFIPISAIGGEWKVALGGPKYAAFEVESGKPLQSRSGVVHSC